MNARARGQHQTRIVCNSIRLLLDVNVALVTRAMNVPLGAGRSRAIGWLPHEHPPATHASIGIAVEVVADPEGFEAVSVAVHFAPGVAAGVAGLLVAGVREYRPVTVCPDV